MTGNEIPDLHHETDPGLGDPPRTILMTDRITVGEDAWDRDVQVFVVAGEVHEGAFVEMSAPTVVIALDGDPQTEVEPWGLIDLSDPDVVQRLAETLIAAGAVLRQIQNGGLS